MTKQQKSACVAFTVSGSDQVGDVEQGDDHAIDFVFQRTIGRDAELVRLAIARADLFGSHGNVTHYIEHPTLKLRNLNIQRQVRESFTHIMTRESEDALGIRRAALT